jgi:flagellar export protein FliJ
MRRALDALLRLRGVERDRARLAEAAAARKAAAARAELDECTRREQEAANALLEAGGEGRHGPWWQGAAGATRQLSEQAGAGRVHVGELEAASAQAQAELVRRERGLRVIERARERLAESVRRKSARAAQRRIDDLAAVRRTLSALVLAAGLATLPSPISAVDEQRDPGLAPILAELRAKQTELERRERELGDRERHAGELEAKAEARLAEAAALVGQLEQRIADFEAAQGDKSMARVARIYGSMPPRAAAALIDRLELELATRIVAKMKPDQSSELLPLLAPERALALSRRVARPLAANVQEKR